MKEFQLEQACVTLRKLVRYELPVKVAYNLFMLTKNVEPLIEFGDNRKQSLVSKYNVDVGENGALEFKDKQIKAEFIKEFNELQNMDVEIDFEPVRVSLSMFGEQKLSPYDIASLDGLVIFEDD